MKLRTRYNNNSGSQGQLFEEVRNSHTGHYGAGKSKQSDKKDSKQRRSATNTIKNSGGE